MKKKCFLVLFGMVVLMVRCSSGEVSAEIPVDEEAAVVSGEQDSMSEKALYPENVFQRFDAVKKVLYEWNEAVSRHRTVDMEKLYAGEVMYYSTKMDKQSLFNHKNEWFKKHRSYSQELGHYEIQYDDSDSLGLEFRAVFTKICIEDSKRTEVEAFLCFRKIEGDWRIVKESDMLTEVNTARKKPPASLPEGKYHYYQGYWADTREVPQFAHDMVPYNVTLDFSILPSGVKGMYNEYSGTTRSQLFYLVKSGKITNGILELEMVYSPSDDPSPEDLTGNEESETWRFKILPDQRLIGISKENVTLYARTLRLLN